ncbi:MAG: LamG-like jellyroll fold domain-containing protein [Verrucomicrobiales bacterium]
MERLSQAYFDQCLTAEDKRELEATLLSSARARRLFLNDAYWHGLTREWVLRQQGELFMADLDPPARPPLRGRSIQIALGLAACLLLGWILLFPQFKKEDELHEGLADHQHGVALLAHMSGAVWEKNSYDVGTELTSGLVEIREGTVRLDFYNGARVTLQGPASLSLLSADLARLHYGELIAFVPPSAAGFTVLNEQWRVVDRGTEFGLKASGKGDFEVHVFKGEVEVQNEVAEVRPRSLRQGQALVMQRGSQEELVADRSQFISSKAIETASARAQLAQAEDWEGKTELIRSARGLLVYYDFETVDTRDMLVKNRALSAQASTHASVIGCEILNGRWPGNSALGFAKTSDRVSFRLDGESRSLTMMAWVRVDSLPREHNALFSMSPDQIGEIHWKIDQEGRLLLGLRADAATLFRSWERLMSPRIVNDDDFGRWMHLATVIDGEKRVMRHYLNGEEVAASPLARPVPIRLGSGLLGNCASMPMGSPPEMIRHFNGRIDDFILFQRALDAEEIKALR